MDTSHVSEESCDVSELHPKMTSEMGTEVAAKKGFRFRQVVNLATVASTAVFSGMVIGWAAVLPKLEEDTSKFHVNKEHVSLLVSFLPILGIATSLVASSLMEWLGPRRMILCAIFPMPGFWLMKAYSPYLALLYVGRGGLAITSSLIGTALQPLVAELSPSNIRGLASSSAEIVAAIGVLVSYLLAHFLPWGLATAVSAVPCLPIFLMLLTVPESPYWLIRQNKREEAEQSLKNLAASGTDVAEQLNAIAATSAPNKASFKYQASQLKKQQNSQPVLLLWVMFILRELGGKSALFSYSVYMFRQAKVEIDPFVCTILIGIIRVVGNIASALTMDRIGRRPFLMISSFICGISIGMTGLFLMLELPGQSWMPLVLLLLFVGSFGIGLGPIPWIYVGELIPTPVRSLGASLITATYNLVIFGLNYAFLKIIAELELGTTLMIFSLPNFLVVLMVSCWFPETRGKSLQELEKAFKTK
ncbi:facilitated trehalose transporter Tret1-2 homolog isoform X1 [Macrobrachium rosenbergii]|uniref:facilitated trehalose transporter Tret1-2 homolog isoform X1 n=3 Tax=Macrobrachium rosenbergii TaxID=79674 RepID=UPI0034D79EF2